ncbi:GFA family protein [Jannaschia sp. S6380]|uniref:GFA family protein n=1 Tax=Jannaschia sp. S6380 TaxID=2926408 RepID=UPI001FF4C217|nr:GFA family protein [Jannaschia sp. S6380]MCK0167555.1 GFA family protein [Jannaschia sp. S6380]
MRRAGSCLCGAVTFAVDGPMRPVVACHCGQCRRTTGNFVAATSAPRDALTVAGEVRWFRSSDEARRGFCPTCGSQLFWDGPGANLSIMAGALDGPTGLALAGHIFCADRGDWYDLPATERQVPGCDAKLTTKAGT